ncbi:hypothetical protein F5Y17DRAFT_105480 [Xylariaceae sp. FL0594]|nr:hypothetical protein F5Y17DRAFT_105480 [Xylariaceae sp. FL0594]
MGNDTVEEGIPSGHGHHQQRNNPGSDKKKPPLSCTSCRARKLKCDKKDPCHNCQRIGSECVFPARKRIQRPRRTKNTELLRRLDRLETIVSKVGLAYLDKGDAAGEVISGTAGSGSQKQQQQKQPQSHPTAAVVVQQRKRDNGFDDTDNKGSATRTPHGPTVSRYLSGEFWSSLCDEVGGLRQALEQSTDSDVDEDEEASGDGVSPPEASSGGGGGGGRTSSTQTTPPGMLLGTLAMTTSNARHPSPEHIRYLAAAFFRNVEMHLKILHRPTIRSALDKLADDPQTAASLGPERESLFFAIYYAAVTSLSPSECTHHLQRSRADLASLFQAGLETALVRADYLNNTSLETLQALTLYTCCLRSHSPSRASWALLGLPIRLAQGLNIHRDGDGSSSSSRLTPYEAEMRRRLWWQLIVLDIRAAEDRGTNTIIARGSYDTRLPHNIDDADFGPDTTAPLEDRPGPTDATFSLCTAQCSGLFLRLEHAPSSSSSPKGNLPPAAAAAAAAQSSSSSREEEEEDMVRQARHLEAQFVRGADPNHVGSYLASMLVRLIILKMWLVTRYPLHPRGTAAAAAARRRTTIPSSSSSSSKPPSGVFPLKNPDYHAPSIPPATRDEPLATLRTALSAIELQEYMQTGPYSDRFRWWTDTYVQWHPLAVALAELCSISNTSITTTSTAENEMIVDRAWHVVDDVFPRWSRTIADTERGDLWRPLRRLYKKAKSIRQADLMAKARGGGEMQHAAEAHPHPTITTTTTTTTSEEDTSSIMHDDSVSVTIPGIDTDTDTGRKIHPRLINDMSFICDIIVSESAAAPPPPPPPSSSSVPNNNNNNNNNNPSTTTDISSSQQQQQPWLTWPPPDLNLNLNFDMGMGGNNIPISMPLPPPMSMTETETDTNINTAGLAHALDDPTLLDESNTRMDWSAWDEFLLDAYAAELTPQSGSGASEAS